MCQTSDHEEATCTPTLRATRDRARPLFPPGHLAGDWGSVPPEDARENDFSVLNGLRILSRYEIAGEPIWIITEADRSSTTLLFPSEY